MIFSSFKLVCNNSKIRTIYTVIIAYSSIVNWSSFEIFFNVFDYDIIFIWHYCRTWFHIEWWVQGIISSQEEIIQLDQPQAEEQLNEEYVNTTFGIIDLNWLIWVEIYSSYIYSLTFSNTFILLCLTSDWLLDNFKLAL